MENKNQVPKITIDGNTASSNAMLDNVTADTCACWDSKEFEKAKKLLKNGSVVECEDATAYVALKSLALEMLMHGRKVKAKIIKNW